MSQTNMNERKKILVWLHRCSYCHNQSSTQLRSKTTRRLLLAEKLGNRDSALKKYEPEGHSFVSERQLGDGPRDDATSQYVFMIGNVVLLANARCSGDETITIQTEYRILKIQNAGF